MRQNLYQFIQIFFDCPFMLESSHRLMHDIQRLGIVLGVQCSCEMWDICCSIELLFYLILLILLLTFCKGGKKANELIAILNEWQQNVCPISFIRSTSTVMFAIAANFYRCWLVFAYIVSEWRRWTILYPLLINLYFSSFYQGSICLMLRARQLFEASNSKQATKRRECIPNCRQSRINYYYYYWKSRNCHQILMSKNKLYVNVNVNCTHWCCLMCNRCSQFMLIKTNGYTCHK